MQKRQQKTKVQLKKRFHTSVNNLDKTNKTNNSIINQSVSMKQLQQKKLKSVSVKELFNLEYLSEVKQQNSRYGHSKKNTETSLYNDLDLTNFTPTNFQSVSPKKNLKSMQLKLDQMVHHTNTDPKKINPDYYNNNNLLNESQPKKKPFLLPQLSPREMLNSQKQENQKKNNSNNNSKSNTQAYFYQKKIRQNKPNPANPGTNPPVNPRGSEGLLKPQNFFVERDNDSRISQFMNDFSKYQKSQIMEKQEKEENLKEKALVDVLMSDDSGESSIDEKFKKEIDQGKEFPDLFKHYKNQNKIEQINSLAKKKCSPFTDILKKSEEQKILLKKFCIPKEQQKLEHIRVSNFGLGDKQSECLSLGINSIKNHIKDIDLSNNHISDKGMLKLLQNLNHDIEQLNIAYNKIGLPSCCQLKKIVQNSSFQLCHINLEGNMIGNKGAQVIIEGCMQRKLSLKYLNLSKNKLNHEIAYILKEYLIDNEYLDELYLHWNEIHNTGFKLIGEAMLENNNLKVLDISYNGIGTENCMEGCQIWSQVFNRTEKLALLHLDFSYNQFTFEESKVIADGLSNNHSIYGFHFRGNEGKMTCKQFLRLKEDDDQYQNKLDLENHGQGEWQIMHRIDSVKVQRVQKYLQNCWICEGWVEGHFSWTPFKSGNVATGPIFVHFDFDEFRPHQMTENEDGQFNYKQICPPNKQINYFFTAAGHQVIADDQRKRAHNINRQIRIPYSDDVQICHMSQMNILNTEKNEALIDPEDYVKNTELKPRIADRVYLCPPKEAIGDIPWSFENSIFRSYKRDEEELLNKCFEFDWECCKLNKVVREDEMKDIKSFFKKKYRYLKNVYKYYSSVNPCGEIWSISNNVYLDMLSQAQIIDDFYGNSDADFNFIAVNTNTENWKKAHNPQRAIVRYEFMECIIRNTNDKLVKTKKCINLVEAIDFAFESGINNFFDTVTYEHEWKQKVYWTELNDTCIKKYICIIEYVFKKFLSKQYKKKCLRFQDYKNFINDSGVCQGDRITERDVNLSYNLAVMTQVDEITKLRHMELYLVEFYESLARLAEAMNPGFAPHGENEENWSKEKIKALPLHIKLESFIIYLYNVYAPHDKNFREENHIPEKSIFAEEIEWIKQGLQTIFVDGPKRHEARKIEKRRGQVKQSVVGQAIVNGFQNSSRRGSQRPSFDSDPRKDSLKSVGTPRNNPTRSPNMASSNRRGAYYKQQNKSVSHINTQNAQIKMISGNNLIVNNQGYGKNLQNQSQTPKHVTTNLNTLPAISTPKGQQSKRNSNEKAGTFSVMSKSQRNSNERLMPTPNNNTNHKTMNRSSFFSNKSQKNSIKENLQQFSITEDKLDVNNISSSDSDDDEVPAVMELSRANSKQPVVQLQY